MKKNSWKIRALALTLMAVCWLSGCSAHKEISVTAAETQEETRELFLNTETEAETQPEAEPEERCEKDGKIQSYLTRGMDGCRKGEPPSARNHDEQ